MIVLLFTASAAIYVAYSWLSYTPYLKDTKWGFWAALLTGALVSLLWLMLAKRTPTAERLFFYSLCWDAVVLVASLIIPLTLFEVRPTLLSMIGFILFVLGLVIFKLGSQT